MTLALIIFSALIILTKFADCYTTSKHIGVNSGIERNPLAKFLMDKFGIQNTIWIIFLFTVVIVLVTLVYALEYDSLVYDILFISFALIISVVQLFVAMNNHTGKQNFLTKLIHRIYN